jgi:hypothetical protein
MTTEGTTRTEVRREKRVSYQTAASAPIYGMGMIGAWVYYLTHAGTIWIGLLGILKGIFWPGFLVYEALKYLGM